MARNKKIFGIFGRRKKNDLTRALKELAIFGIGLYVLLCLFGYWLEVNPNMSQEQYNRDMLKSQQIGWERKAFYRNQTQELGDRWLMLRTNQ